MTTALWDVPRTDLVVFMGSNAAENHPISMKWFLRAKENGAKFIVLDPRFTRSASKADWYIPFRAGSDIVVLGGLIRYAIENGRFHRDYVLHYTNASLLVNPRFGFHDGLFTGWDPEAKTYNRASWTYQLDENGNPLRDMTLQHKDTVFQHLRRQFAKYTPEMVSEATGIPVETFIQLAEEITATCAPDKSAVFAYAMGWTQHTKGVQNIRTAAMLQLLLGNIGVPGGGIAALRGHANVQGATDLAVLWHDLPGYLGIPRTSHRTLDEFIEKTTPSSGFWLNKKKFMVSLLKAWWGEHATPENDFAYHYIPKARADKHAYSHYDIFEDALQGIVKGLFVVGQNPAVGSADAGRVQQALAKLDWLVVLDIFQNDTSEFWKLPGVNPANIKTEVFFLPGAGPLEKAGTFTNTHRLIQWKDKAIDPIGGSKGDLWYANALALRLKRLYADSTKPQDEPIKYLHWDYGAGIDEDPDTLLVLREINGYEVATGKLLSSFGQMQADGSTAGGCWIYTGAYTEAGNITAKREINPDDYLHHGWGFAWPANRRVLYNRASADPQGRPWAESKRLIWWDGSKWTGLDVPDMLAIPPDGYSADYKMGGDNPFIMQAWGLGGLFGPLADGPFPAHYEPIEAPVANMLHAQATNPVARVFSRVGDVKEFPYVMTTYRLTEHLTSGIMTRWLPWLAEAFPHPFVEISPELAREHGIRNGDWVRVRTARGEVRVKALVTRRLQPLRIGGRIIHQIGMPIHWSTRGLVTGDIANTLTPQFQDPNVQIQESKAFLASLERLA